MRAADACGVSAWTVRVHPVGWEEMVGEAPGALQGNARRACKREGCRPVIRKQHDMDWFFLLEPEENDIDSLMLFSLEWGEM